MPDGVLRIYDPGECSADGKPSDWERCRNCGGEGRKGRWRAGSIVRVEDGVASATCAVCGGHGSLKAAVLAECIDRVHHASIGYEPQVIVVRCEDCGHPMSAGTWEGSDGSHPDVFGYALTNIRGGQEPGVGVGIHYSPCDEGCRHGGPIWVQEFGFRPAEEPWEELQGVTAADVAAAVAVQPVRASWRPVDVRTLGWPHDLRPERLAVLCLRCWAERSRPATAGTT